MRHRTVQPDLRAVTLRNLPPELARIIRRRAQEERTSVNKAVIRLLEEALLEHRKTQRPLYRDLDSLAGSWTEEQAAEFDRDLASQRIIDPELWK